MSRLPMGLCGVVVSAVALMALTVAATSSDTNAIGEASVFDVYRRVTSSPDLPRVYPTGGRQGIPIFSMSEDMETWPDAIVLTHVYGYQTNHGDEHVCPATPGLEGPWGVPGARDGRGATLDPFPQSACAGGRRVENDSAQTLERWPKYHLAGRSLCRLNGAWWGGEPRLPVVRELTGAHCAATVRYEGEKEYLPGVHIPPFSRCEVHWPITVTGEIITLVYLPYHGPPEEKRRIAAEIGRSFNWQDGVGAEAPSRAVAAEASFTEEQKQRWHVGDPLPLGDMIGVIIEERGGPVMFGLESITAPVTFRLEANKTAPDDAPGLIDGTATLVQGEAFTRDGSPPGLRSPLQLVFPSTGQDKGRCTVELAKGYRYEVTSVRSPRFDTIYAPPTGGMEFTVRGKQDVRIGLRLVVARELVVRSEQAGGKPVPAEVIVSDSSGKAIRVGNTEADGQGHCSCILRDLAAPARYTVRAKPRGGSDSEYGDPQMIILKPSTRPQIVSVRVGGPQP